MEEGDLLDNGQEDNVSSGGSTVVEESATLVLPSVQPVPAMIPPSLEVKDSKPITPENIQEEIIKLRAEMEAAVAAISVAQTVTVKPRKKSTGTKASKKGRKIKIEDVSRSYESIPIDRRMLVKNDKGRLLLQRPRELNKNPLGNMYLQDTYGYSSGETGYGDSYSYPARVKSYSSSLSNSLPSRHLYH